MTNEKIDAIVEKHCKNETVSKEDLKAILKELISDKGFTLPHNI